MEQDAVCAWCGEQATTEIWTTGKPGARKQILAPVCDDHERSLTAGGATVSVRQHESELREKDNRKRPSWAKR